MNNKLIMGISCALALGACAATPKTDAALEQAQAAVNSAQADPNVSKYSSLDLANAEKELANAQAAANQGHMDEVDQPAYLAMETARIAQVRAAAKADDARVAAGQGERDRILLNAKTREAETARAKTEIALDQRDIAAQQAASLQGELDQLKATQTARGIVLTLGDVLFDTGKAELKPGAARKLDQLAQFLNDHPDRRVEIDGFTDSVGSDSYNEELSQNRADSVRSALLARGIDGTRITTQGFGKSYPVATNTDSSGRQLNRRVEVVIGSNGGSAIAPRTSDTQAPSSGLRQ